MEENESDTDLDHYVQQDDKRRNSELEGGRALSETTEAEIQQDSQDLPHVHESGYNQDLKNTDVNKHALCEQKVQMSSLEKRSSGCQDKLQIEEPAGRQDNDKEKKIIEKEEEESSRKEETRSSEECQVGEETGVEVKEEDEGKEEQEKNEQVEVEAEKKEDSKNEKDSDQDEAGKTSQEEEEEENESDEDEDEEEGEEEEEEINCCCVLTSENDWNTPFKRYWPAICWIPSCSTGWWWGGGSGGSGSSGGLKKYSCCLFYAVTCLFLCCGSPDSRLELCCQRLPPHPSSCSCCIYDYSVRRPCFG